MDTTTSRNLGPFPYTSALAPWVGQAITQYKPSDETLDLVRAFTAELHTVLNKERAVRSGLQDIDTIEAVYRVTLEVSASILLAADATLDPIEVETEIHSSRAAQDEHLGPWGHLLAGIDCDPPIIGIFPLYIMFCHASMWEPPTTRENYIRAAMCGVDWAKGDDEFRVRFEKFVARSEETFPSLKEDMTGPDGANWRVGLAYLTVMNKCENARLFRAPKHAAIKHSLDHDLVLAVRAVDGLGLATMSSDGAQYIDNDGFNSLFGSIVPNDIMDLHTDIKTGETRNFLRLIYPPGFTLPEAMKAVATILSTHLCQLLRGEALSREEGRNDGRIAAASSAYSLSRARHRHLFEVLELYTTRYPLFWKWTEEIFEMAKAQVNEYGVNEGYVTALKRSVTGEMLGDSPRPDFFDSLYNLVCGGGLEYKKLPGVSNDFKAVLKEIHNLWYTKVLASKDLEAGWGKSFDVQSDALLGKVGRFFLESSDTEEMYKFARTYEYLSLGVPYVAYHTIDAIILAFGII